MNKVRYGIIGLGTRGLSYAEKLYSKYDSNGILVAICDSSNEKLAKGKQFCPDAIAYTDYNEIVASNDIDAVVIATHNAQHNEIASIAIRAGKHVLTEIPAGISLSEVRPIIEMQKEKGLQFGILNGLRGNKLYEKAKQIISNNELGEVKRVMLTATNMYRPQAYYDQDKSRNTYLTGCGGILYNQYAIQIDILTYLVGLPMKVRGYTRTIGRNTEAENEVTAYLEYDNGASGVLIFSSHEYPGTDRLVIIGTGGSIVIENHKLTFTRLTTPEPNFNETTNIERPHIASKKLIVRHGLFSLTRELIVGANLSAIPNFSSSIIGKAELSAPIESSTDSIMLTSSIYLSSWLSRDVIIPIDEKLFLEEYNRLSSSDEN